MNSRKYQELVEEITPKENRLMNMIISFVVGGLIGVLGTIIYVYLKKYYEDEIALSFMLIIIILLTSLLTNLGVADNLFQKYKCGLIIPITGFAHSISASILDYKKEGLLNIGSNTFKLAGSVILYGTVGAILLTLIKVILNV